MTLRLAWLFTIFGLALIFSQLSLAQAPQHDPNLPSVKPDALRELSDNRIRQDIMQESQARYRGRCVCPHQSQDANGRSCKGRHEVIKTRSAPLCYPAQVSKQMIRNWKNRHP